MDTITDFTNSDLADLRSSLNGTAVLPSDEGYDSARAGYQAGLDTRPAVIINAASATDVAAAVRLAVDHGLPVAVQATGHGRSAASQGGVLINTRDFDATTVDREHQTAWISAGTRWNQVIDAAAPYGLAPLSGSSPELGAVSYTLGGGVGILSRQFGYAADHVRRIEIVTADGQLKMITAENDPDLFWAVRGGRDNFGIVTGMEVELFKVETLYGGELIFDAAHVPEALATYLDWTKTVPEELTSSVSIMQSAEVRGRYVAAIRIAFLGSEADGNALVEPLRDVGPRITDSLREMPYADTHTIFHHPTQPHAYYGSNLLLTTLSADELGLVLKETGPDAPFWSIVQVNHLGGALGRLAEITNAVGHREAQFIITLLVPVDGPDDHEQVREFVLGVLGKLEAQALGRSLNFLFGEGDPEQIRSAYSVEDYRRLVWVKQAFDPGNIFRRNQNIPLEG